ncbi:MAG: hypothetical protein GF355_12875 [Candidatus Eisenbacteria bacterium]|nr:hypothetical protein [Candidatus Eisenbacteria bacterium]
MRSPNHVLPILVVAAVVLTVILLPGCSDDNGTCPGITNDPDPAAPSPPAALHLVKGTPDGLLIGWEASPDPDLAGYLVYVYDPDPSRDNAYVRLTEQAIQRAGFSYEQPAADSTYIFKVTAVSGEGAESPATPPFSINWTGGPQESRQEDPGGAEPPRGCSPDIDPPDHPEPGEDDPHSET